MRRIFWLMVVVVAASVTHPVQANPQSQAMTPGQAPAKTQASAAAAPDRAAIEKTLIANERTVNDAFAKGNAAGFRSLVAADSWSIDPMGGRMSTAEMLKGFDQMAKETKVTSWDITDSQVMWVDQNVAVHSYKWVGQGTYQGQPMPSPVWASTVWARRGGKWQAVFHQESTVAPPAK
jgi:hypothetical protein